MTRSHSRECLRHRICSRWVGGQSPPGMGAGKGYHVLMTTRMFLNLQVDILCYLVHIQTSLTQLLHGLVPRVPVNVCNEVLQ